MKKFLISAIAALALTGCSKPPQSDFTATANPDNEFILAVESKIGPVERTSTLHLGHTICEGFDSGLTIYDIAREANRAGVDPTTAGTIAGLSIKHLCPRHLDKFNGL